jgi:hypothetical protein
LHLSIEGLEDLVDRVVAEKVAAALDGQATEDPWYDSAAAAQYLGVTRQCIHDLVWSGALARSGEKGERLYFRRSTLDAYREGAPSNDGLLP